MTSLFVMVTRIPSPNASLLVPERANPGNSRFIEFQSICSIDMKKPLMYSESDHTASDIRICERGYPMDRVLVSDSPMPQQLSIPTLADDEFDVLLPIDGLRFERNLIRDIASTTGWFTTKLLSSEGPLVSDFVTHEIGFAYTSYGIHVGQVDRLTFMGECDGDGFITGHFVDCRNDSSDLHRKVSIRYRPSLWRRLVVPKGVAHTFDNVARVVTRDEPIWYADFDNIDWDVNNDLVSIPRGPNEVYPVVRVNQYRMPDEVHRFVSRLSQSILETPMAYSSRHLLTIGGKDTYVSFQAKNWTDNEAEMRRLLSVPEAPGVAVQRARYAITGPKSWTLVPSTGSCVGDVLVLPPRVNKQRNKFLHRRTRKWYTFLTNPGTDVQLELTDYRPDSPTFGAESVLHLTTDPRISLSIDPGIAYSLSCERDLLVRCEHEVYVATDEPRSDLPALGGDLIIVLDNQPPALNPTLPTLRCPDELVRQMARVEQELVTEVRE